MESDRKLLELAAKAYGLKDGRWTRFETQRDPDWAGSTPMVWNPLDDDGDALRLAVKRNVFFNPLFVHYLARERFAQQDSDDAKAHRRAIVRTVADEIAMGAAEIGKTLG